MPRFSELLSSSSLSAIDARVLLSCAAQKEAAWLYAHGDEVAPDATARRFETLAARRRRGEPVAYLVGEKEFWGLNFRTTPATLIPRPDTETLVAAALEVLPENSTASVLDMGTGTGAVGISIAHERPNISLTLSDVSKAALDVARENAEILLTAKGFKGGVACVQSNWFERFPLDEFQSHFDLIASNPPYIKAEDEHLSQGDLRFEPQNALASGATGLDALTIIVSRAPKYLKRGGWLMVEHGYDQSEEVEALFRGNGFREISHRHDLGGIQRVVCGQI